MRLELRRPRRVEAGARARALDRPRAGDHRRRRAADDAYIGPYTAIGEDCVDRARRGRALDPARGLEVARPRGAPGVVAARPQVARHAATTASRARYRFWSATTREIGILLRMKRSLVTGAGGMLGQDVIAAARERGHEVAALTRADLDVTDERPCARRRRGRARTRSSTAPRGPTSTAPRSDEAARYAVNGDGAGNVARAAAGSARASSTSRPTTSSTATAPTPYVESDPVGAARGLRPHASSPANAPSPRPTRDHAIVRTAWLFGAAARTSSTRC